MREPMKKQIKIKQDDENPIPVEILSEEERSELLRSAELPMKTEDFEEMEKKQFGEQMRGMNS